MLNRPKPSDLLILDRFGYPLEQENNANYDMLGHTGIIPVAILIAVEAVDKSLQRIVDALKSVGGQLLLMLLNL